MQAKIIKQYLIKRRYKYMATPHINAKDGAFAKIILMPGDPYRAKWMAETFLHDYELVTDVRGILGFTGYTKSPECIQTLTSKNRNKNHIG